MLLDAMSLAMSLPRRVLITLDAVGGVWRYALDLAHGLGERGIACHLVGFGPRPACAAEIASMAACELTWLDEPLDWMVQDPALLEAGAASLDRLSRDWRADLLHLNLPSQAALVASDLPIAVAAHSCLPTWWAAVRGGPLPQEWVWQHSLNRRGFDRAQCVLAPSASHGAALARTYGEVKSRRIVANATELRPLKKEKDPFVLAAGRWWDDGKNGAVLDIAAASAPWPVVMAGPLASPLAGPNATRLTLAHAIAAGELPSHEMQDLMRRAAVFAAPSRYEPFGLAVLEAAMNGAALLLADIATFRELWDGAALFVSPSRPEEFAQAMAGLAGSPSLRQELGARARARAESLTPARQIDALLAAYAEIIAARPRTSKAA